MYISKSTQRPKILEHINREYGFVYFEDGDYDLNIIGERRIGDRSTNAFDDYINIVYLEHGKWNWHRFEATTDPGSYWLQKPGYKPTAIMKHPQQARGSWVLGEHRGQYPALVQWKPIQLWRDGNKDNHLDYTGPVSKELVGINIHRSSIKDGGSDKVDKWSAGCQVFKDRSGLDKLVELARLQKSQLGYHTFTYTLIPMMEE